MIHIFLPTRGDEAHFHYFRTRSLSNGYPVAFGLAGGVAPCAEWLLSGGL